jgi:hypothetical protein
MPDVDFCRGRFQLQDLGQVLAICDAGEIHGEDKNLISRRPIEREAWMMVVQLRQQTRVSWARERANHRKPAGPPQHGCKATRLHGAWDLLILRCFPSSSAVFSAGRRCMGARDRRKNTVGIFSAYGWKCRLYQFSVSTDLKEANVCSILVYEMAYKESLTRIWQPRKQKSFLFESKTPGTPHHIQRNHSIHIASW